MMRLDWNLLIFIAAVLSVLVTGHGVYKSFQGDPNLAQFAVQDISPILDKEKVFIHLAETNEYIYVSSDEIGQLTLTDEDNL